MSRDEKDDNASVVLETSTAAFTACSSPNDPTIVDGVWDGRVFAIPWPKNKYIILEKGTDRAICLGNQSGRLYLSDDPNANNHWSIEEHQGYFGFNNPRTGKYIGHNGRQVIHAAVKHLADWESFVPRKHPDGGYQLLSPFYSHTMRVVCVASDGRGLERRQHGETQWEFVKV